MFQDLPNRVASGRVTGGRKDVTERAKETPLWRPVRNCKYDVGKGTAEFGLQSLPKIDRGATRVIGECTTSPSAKNERRVAVSTCNGKYPQNAFLQEVPGFRLANRRSIRCRAGEKAKQPRTIEFRPVIVPEDRHIGRVDCPIRGIRPFPFPMVRVHRVTGECLVQRARPTKHLFLSARPAEKASAWVNPVGEVQSERPQAAFSQTLRCLEGRFIGNLNAGFTLVGALRSR